MAVGHVGPTYSSGGAQGETRAGHVLREHYFALRAKTYSLRDWNIVPGC